MDAPVGIKTEREATRCSCPFYPALVGQHGELRFITCRASECMAWRWTEHRKIENRDPRPTGFCGRIEFTPVALSVADLPEVLPSDLPAPTSESSIITQ